MGALLWLALPLGAAGAGVVFTRELYRHVFERGGSRLLTPLLDKKGHEPDYYLHRDTAADRLRSLPQERLSLVSARGETLRGFYFDNGARGKRIAFLVHGYRSEHAETAGMYYDCYRRRGVDLFCCDQYAHGESGGEAIGFGAAEAEDCLAWLELLIERFGPDTQILLHGFSMGAATVLNMSDRLPPQVKFLIADSGYMDAREQLKGQLGAMFQPLRLMNWRKTGRDLQESDARPRLDRSRVPILFVHGEADRTVPFVNGPRLMNYYQGPREQLFVPGARHIESMHVAPEAYEARLDAMLDLCFRR